MPRKKQTSFVSPEQPSSLRLLSVQVKNVLGIDERSIDAEGRAVVVEGANATGKTSLLQAVQTALSGGNLAKLARVGADEDPEVVLVLGGPGGDFRVEKRGKETARVLQRVGDSQAFADVARPQEFLTGLFDPRVANPVAWLLAKPKDQARLLLEALSLELDEEALGEVLGPVSGHVRPIPQGLHALEHVAMLREQLFSARTGVNRDAKAKAGSAEQLRRELPAKPPENPADEIVTVEAYVISLEADHAKREEKSLQDFSRFNLVAKQDRDHGVADVRQRFKDGEETQRADFEARAATLRADVEKEIGRMKDAVETKIATAREVLEAQAKGYDEILAAARAEADRVKEEQDVILKEEAEEIANQRLRLMTLRGTAENAIQYKALDEQATGFEAEAEHHGAESKLLSLAIDGLDLYARTLAKKLPIDGLEIEDAEIRLGGVPLSQVNESTRVEVAAKVAQARAERNPLKLVFLDGLERLDTAHREALLTYLVDRDVQAIGAVVTDGKPTVKYIGAVSE